MPKTIGILALQGDFAAHARMVQGLGCNARLVRRRGDFEGLEGLVFPGGESTTMSMLMGMAGLRDGILQAVESGIPVLATCAGVILLASSLTGFQGSVQVEPLGLLDVAVERNSYGRQRESFEAALEVDWGALGMEQLSGPISGIFIRAPRITSVGEGVEVISALHDDPCLVRQSNILAATFHPELSGDSRLHKFLFNTSK